ncbi:uncharacterized protein VTP21DRAFT_4895 [Calcarisporiella thermophila]|uniref:uncharacterized protein n=1 Tax=Calcarisporiella thermophila TaxID=911321 RepID=UPI003742D2B1
MDRLKVPLLGGFLAPSVRPPPPLDEKIDSPVNIIPDLDDSPAAFPSPDGPQMRAPTRIPNSTGPRTRHRQKIVLPPGSSPLDWARLKSSGADLRAGHTTLGRYTLEDLKQHKTVDDCWTAIQGKVYNLTPYVRFHPGGERDLLRIAGRDGTKLFLSTHAWVNVEILLDKCLVGFLVSE